MVKFPVLMFCCDPAFERRSRKIYVTNKKGIQLPKDFENQTLFRTRLLAASAKVLSDFQTV